MYDWGGRGLQISSEKLITPLNLNNIFTTFLKTATKLDTPPLIFGSKSLRRYPLQILSSLWIMHGPIVFFRLRVTNETKYHMYHVRAIYQPILQTQTYMAMAMAFAGQRGKKADD